MTQILAVPNVIDTMILELENKNLDLKDYANDLNDAAKANSSQVFANHDYEYAAIALAILFSKTEKEFCLIVDSFKGDVSNNKNYVAALEELLRKGVNAKILTLYTPNEDSEGYKLLNVFRQKNKEQVQIRIATQESINAIQESMKKSLLDFKEPHNLGVFDDDKYRLEYIPTQFKAFVSMNNKAVASIHRQTFDDAFGYAIDYPVQERVVA